MKEELKNIEIDSSSIRNRIIASGLIVVVFCLTISILFASLFNYTNRVETITIAVLWVSFMSMWALSSIISWNKLRKNKYILAKDSLVVKNYSIAGSSEKLYRYDSFLSIEVRKSIFNRSSGKIVISIPKMSEPIILDNVVNPDEIANVLKSRINKSSGTKSLIN